MGYYNNPKATTEAFNSEGFLRTGDEGSISSEGLITIHDRIKEMIKVKGIQVAPAELEDLLLGYPKVDDCAVIGVPDDYSGEIPLGFVVLKEGIVEYRGLVEGLMEYVKAKKVRTKWLAGLKIVDRIPKSASGKILRIMRDRFKGEVTNLKAKL
jgi:acyl-coenzyme A synthetase/AMP-(fatty) acid ligase